jgi:hypothetical protein
MLTKIIGIHRGRDWIAAASSGLQQEAEDLQERAEGAESIGKFYGPIFESAPLAIAAHVGFDALARFSSGDAQKEYRSLAAVCDERFAIAAASIASYFDLALDARQLLAHRAKIELAREQKGEDAARKLAKQYIKLMIAYPGYFEPFLLGETDTWAMGIRTVQA